MHGANMKINRRMFGEIFCVVGTGTVLCDYCGQFCRPNDGRGKMISFTWR